MAAQRGGNLQLHRDAWRDTGTPDVEVLPEYGRAIIFETSERSWHGFEQITAGPTGETLSRRSIALYFYSESRPHREITAEHGTYYVGRPLPNWLVEGATISKAHLDYLEEENSPQRDWISYLYDREVRWSTDFGRLNEERRHKASESVPSSKVTPTGSAGC